MNDDTFVDGLPSDDYVAHVGSHGVATLDDVRADVARGREAVPDRTVELEDVIATDRDVVIRWRSTGTHEGPFTGIEPTGERIDVVGSIQPAMEDGRIVEAWNLGDRCTLLELLGVVGLPGA